MLSDISFDQVREGLILFIMLVCSLALHEWGHAIVADKLGDDTPRSQGRVTTNPLAHIDLLGTIILPLLGIFGFFGNFSMIGWAKPVYTNPANFKRGNLDDTLVTIAGPAMNFFLALVGVVLTALAYRFSWEAAAPLFKMMYRLNLSLVVFNLLPIPPLDGSHFLVYWFGMSRERHMRLSMYGGLILVVLLNFAIFRAFYGTLLHIASIPFVYLFNLIA